MKKLLGKLATGRAIGLMIGHRELVLSQVAFTPIGPLEMGRRTEPIEGDTIDVVIPRILAPVLESEAWKNAPIAIGLPVLSVFFSTRPIKSINLDAAPQILLHEVLRSSNLVIDDMDVDMIKSQPGKLPVASIIATRKKYLAPILHGLEKCGVRPSQVEPAPFALLRAAIRRHRTDRGTKSSLRIFLGAESGLAMLTAQDQPLAWRYFEMLEGEEATAVVSSVRSLRTLSRYYGVDTPPDLVWVHGRPELLHLDDTPQWRETHLRMQRFDGPGFNAADTAFGLAMGCHAEAKGLNLARSMRPRDSLLRLLPLGQIGLLVVTMAMATVFLQSGQDELKRNLYAVQTALINHKWMKNHSVADLEKEKASQTIRAKAIQQYLGTRIFWTDCLREISTPLPSTMTVSTVSGHCKLGDTKRDMTNDRLLALNMHAPITGNGVVPAEIDTYLAAMRSSQVIRKALPQIKLSALRWGTNGRTYRPFVAFTVTCQAETKKKPKAKVGKS
ncbi:hypothetical protein SAMN05444166_2594 [Singulisphaera sp. GP187]|uniref:hypothetical protein n=1 Tax=Singulisphaera sp. GP187 TaxID=1882752 RepID=UPI000925AF9C|nr:hypothetical protein [Singulisphaera sp. GP187]SIO12675.1 hypothetical protein SAMN05444166_2594 [Singulisphaera sp. GP187]